MANKGITPNKIAAFTTTGRSEKEISVDEVLGWLLNISFTLLMIFIIATFIFTTRVKVDLEELKDKYGMLMRDFNNLENTPKGELDKALKNALVDLQKHKLMLALDTIEFNEREGFGLIFFAPKNDKGEVRYKMDDILSEGKVISERFKKGCVLAKETLPYPRKMRQDWLKWIEENKKMVLSEPSAKEQNGKQFEVITQENAAWLIRQITTRTQAMYVDCYDMQCQAYSYLIDYYYDHPELLEGTRLSKQLTDSLSAPDGERIRLTGDFGTELDRHIKLLFEKETPLLKGVLAEPEKKGAL